jgi:hypothetical protein
MGYMTVDIFADFQIRSFADRLAMVGTCTKSFDHGFPPQPFPLKTIPGAENTFDII